MATTETETELPRYKCYKEVWALKIMKIERHNEGDPSGSAMITPLDGRYAPFRVEPQYVRRHNPQVGGYYVVYKDGYKSYSPADVFEDGYTLIG